MPPLLLTPYDTHALDESSHLPPSFDVFLPFFFSSCFCSPGTSGPCNSRCSSKRSRGILRHELHRYRVGHQLRHTQHHLAGRCASSQLRTRYLRPWQFLQQLTVSHHDPYFLFDRYYHQDDWSIGLLLSNAEWKLFVSIGHHKTQVSLFIHPELNYYLSIF